MTTYHKIKTLYERGESKKLDKTRFRSPELEYLKDNEWEFTEKIDGTNIRVFWDGHKVQFAGRTDNAQLPAELTTKLYELFLGETNEQIFEQKFGETPVILFGEGYGAKIQNGGAYLDHQDFILFDVMIGTTYVSREAVEDVAKAFGLDVVPIVLTGTLEDGVKFVESCPKSTIGTHDMEGVVGRPKVELKDHNGDRIIVKIKVCDFKEVK